MGEIFSPLFGIIFLLIIVFLAKENLEKKRDIKLKKCDWTQATDSPLSDEKKAEWATYRQAVRDVPANNSSVTDYDNIVWPTSPS